MKVLFLDIDGVLCTHNSDNYSEQDDKFDDKACKNLKKIIDETGCKLVLTSSWRLYSSYIKLLLSLLKPYGITRLDFLGKAKSLLSRAQEISEFLSSHKEITNYIVLDDEQIVSKLIPSDKIIYTQAKSGITNEITKKCIKILMA